MENKTLKRIFKKTLEITEIGELGQALPGLSADILENLGTAIENIDRAFFDFERMIDIRDRSLAISSKELNHLNEEITETARSQKEVLDQLKELLTLLRGSASATAADNSEDLKHLVRDVDRLVKNQLQAAQNLKMLAEEGLKISSTLSFRALEVQLQSSVRVLIRDSADVAIYFSGQLLQTDDAIAFHRCTPNNEPGEPLDTAMLDSDDARFININSAKGHGTLAIAHIQFPKNSANIDGRMLLLESLLPNLGATLENIRLLQEEKHKQHLENELKTARFVQQTLLPPASIRETKELDVSGYYQSASECGGDWWSYFRLNDGRHVVLVGDVTGHGTASAMVCAVVKGYCDSLINRPNLTVIDVLTELNHVVFRMSRDGKRAMTMAAAFIEPEKQEITYANAGHPHPLVLKSDPSPSTSYLINSGSILGISTESIYQEKKFPFRPGDQLVLYTDGVTECMGRTKEMYGDRRLRSILKNSANATSAAELNHKIVHDLKNFYANVAPGDDITTVVIRHTSETSN